VDPLTTALLGSGSLLGVGAAVALTLIRRRRAARAAEAAPTTVPLVALVDQPAPTQPGEAPVEPAKPAVPGWQTTSFWVTAAVQVVAVLVLVGVVRPADQAGVTELVGRGVEALAALAAAVASAWHYVGGRASR
jgi:putative exporter of polyketide antibiotics